MTRFQGRTDPPRRRRGRLDVERFENRLLLTGMTYTVTTTADNGSNLNPTQGSLRQAILAVDFPTVPHSGTDMINFAIGAGVQAIHPPTPMPVVSRAGGDRRVADAGPDADRRNPGGSRSRAFPTGWSSPAAPAPSRG